MIEPVNTTPEIVEQWDRLAEFGFVEATPEELPHGVGGFEYFCLPSGILEGSHQFGGYDGFNTDSDSLEISLMIGENVPKHVRGFLVGHMVMHKIFTDNLSPQMCRDFDADIQAVMSDTEPDLIGEYYAEATQMYLQGSSVLHPQFPGYRVATDRYKMATANALSRGEQVKKADQKREILRQNGLILPDGEIALNTVDSRTGLRTTVSLQTEKGTKHKCKNCSHGIVKGAPRITTSTLQKADGFDHHHYHPGCFTHLEIGAFGDFHQISQDEALPSHQH